MQFIKTKSPSFIVCFILVISFAIASRFIFLSTIPYGINNDEAAYIYSAYSIWKTHGFALEGGRFPLSINVNGNDLSPVPVYLTAPFVGLLGLSPFTARLPFVLLSIGSVLLTFFIAKQLYKNEWIALASMFVMAVSPWHIFMSRSATDADVALFFYLLGVWLFLKNMRKGNILFSLSAFLLAFYSYHATKIFFIFLIPTLLLFYRDKLFKNKKIVGAFLLGVFLILLSFLAITKTQGVIRQNILVWNDPNKIKEATMYVNKQRELTSAPLKVSSLFTNKLLFYGREITRNYLGAFSPEYLFVSGDSVPITAYGMFFNGELYLLDLLFICLGIYFLILSVKNKKEGYLLLSLVAIAATPSAFPANTSYVIRSIMMVPFLSILTGIGIYQSYILIRKFPLITKMLSSSILCIVYLFFISQFLYQYFFQFAIYGGDSWFASSREVAQVIKSEQINHRQVMMGIKEKIILLKLGIFLPMQPAEMRTLWNHDGRGKAGGIVFHRDCLNRGQGNPYDLISTNSAYIVSQDCYTNTDPTKKITSVLNGQEVIWKVYEKP